MSLMLYGSFRKSLDSLVALLWTPSISFMSQSLNRDHTLEAYSTLLTFDCLAASNWQPGHPRSDHHVSNPHRPDYY